MRSQTHWFVSAARADDIDIHIPLKIGVKGDTLPVRRPARRTHNPACLRKEFHGIGSVRIAGPDAANPRTLGKKSNPLTVGRVLCRLVYPCRGNELSWETGGRSGVR